MSTKKKAAEARGGQWSDAAVRVLRERYLIKNEQGEVIETPDEAMLRVAGAVAQAEAPYSLEGVEKYTQLFYELLTSRRFMPNSPTLMNAGKGNNLQLSACFVIPVPDSLDGIFESLKHVALVHKSGGGTGMSFSRLRPKNANIGTTTNGSSGPVSFMKIFDAATEHIKQGGQRRGANMGVLRVDHPDVLEFINCKRDGGVTNFNISVGVTDAFMDALAIDGEYDLVDPHTGAVAGRLSAVAVMTEIVDAAWSTGDPGLIFLDRVNRSPANPTPDIEPIEATNPCGEQPLGPYDACNLGSVNLGLFVKEHDGQHYLAPVERIEWDELAKTVILATRFLDDVIDINPFPLQEIRDKVHANRRIGLGIMGWADMLFRLGIRYDSDAAVELGERVMGFVQKHADNESRALAKERGAFPNFEKSRYAGQAPLRNSNRTTVAPTGTISIIADCSSGVEPIFALAFQHRVKQPDGSYRVLDFVNPLLQETVSNMGYGETWRNALIDNVKRNGSLKLAGENGDILIAKDGSQIVLNPTDLMVLAPFVTAQEIAPAWHIAMQAAFQKHVDSAISKTVNLPNSATRADVEEAYMLAWSTGCQGVTVFRDGCKNEQVLNVGVKPAAEPAPTPAAPAPEPVVEPARPVVPVADLARYPGGIKARESSLSGVTKQVRAPEGKVNVTINDDEDGPFEVFVNVGRAGSDIAALAEALGRLISLNLRLESTLPQERRAFEIARQLNGIGGSGSVGFGPHRVLSLPDAVARSMREHLEERAKRFIAEFEAEEEGLEATIERLVGDPDTARRLTGRILGFEIEERDGVFYAVTPNGPVPWVAKPDSDLKIISLPGATLNQMQAMRAEFHSGTPIEEVAAKHGAKVESLSAEEFGPLSTRLSALGQQFMTETGERQRAKEEHEHKQAEGQSRQRAANLAAMHADYEEARRTGNLCPTCSNNTLVLSEGCKKCMSCGYSAC